MNTDGEGAGDTCDSDDDNDGMTDVYETANLLNPLDSGDSGPDLEAI